MENNNDKLNAAWKHFADFESELKGCYCGVDVGREKDKVIKKYFYNKPEEYKPITKHYNGYREQNVCSICKYYRMRWIDNVCEKHHCIVNAIGICDRFQRNV